jgi:hypothetical protein
VQFSQNKLENSSKNLNFAQPSSSAFTRPALAGDDFSVSFAAAKGRFHYLGARQKLSQCHACKHELISPQMLRDLQRSRDGRSGVLPSLTLPALR